MPQTSNHSVGNLTYRNETVTENELPELVNEFLCSLTSKVAPLASGVIDQLRSELDVSNDIVVISELEVFRFNILPSYSLLLCFMLELCVSFCFMPM